MVSILRFLDEKTQLAGGATDESSSLNEIYADNFGLVCTILSCGIAGYQIT